MSGTFPRVRGELWHTIENAKRDGIKITERDAGIRVLDHVVLGNERFYSFTDRGLL